MNPRLYILFLIDKSMTQIRNIESKIIRNIVIKCMVVFQVSLNFDPVKEILKRIR